MLKYKSIVLDSETTGTSKTDQVIELAHIGFDDDFFIHHKAVQFTILKSLELEDKLNNLFGFTFEQRYKPSVDISPFAYEVHGIDQHMLKDCPKAETLVLPTEIEYAVAHNESFDRRMLRQTMNMELHGQFDEIKWICTLALAKIFDKQLAIGYENHKLDTVIRFHFPEHAEKLIEDKHKALGDVIKCLLFLTVLVEKIPTIQSWEQLHNFQNMMKPKGKKK